MGCVSVSVSAVQQLMAVHLSLRSYSWSGRQSQRKKRVLVPIVNSVAISNAQTKDRLKLKQLFYEAYQRCLNAPMDGVSFTLQDFTAALDKYDFDSEVGTKKSTGEELLEKELPLKFVEVDEEQSRLVLSNRKAMADSQTQLGIGSVVTGSVQSLRPYGAFIDIGGISGLLHVSQISHDHVTDIETVLQPGDTLKVMILSHDQERGRVSLSAKKLEPTPGDMIRNPKLVFEKAEEMAQRFRQRIAQAEAMVLADMSRFQPESGLTLSNDGNLGSLTSDLPED